MKRLLSILKAQLKVSLAETFQYRVQAGLELLGLLVESVIYLIVWTTVADARGGAVGGFTSDEFAGYYIAWTFVRLWTTGWSPWWIERRIRRGDFTPLLLRPVHPIFTDFGRMTAGKTISGLTLVPTIIILSIIFQPSIAFVPWSLLAMLPALIIGYFLRFTLMYAMSLTAFWTTRVTALFQLFFALEFFFSGRAVPLTVLPEWAQQIAEFLPYQWMFYFPLELLLGRLTPQETMTGFLIQIGWFALTLLAFVGVWRAGVRRYVAVGG
jgi:ABC-2 type transport system permease protein